MAKCCRCGNRFDVSEARIVYNAEFNGEIDYDEEYGSEVCAYCAISDTDTNMNLGKAIDMMNGDEEYDDDFIEKHL